MIAFHSHAVRRYNLFTAWARFFSEVIKSIQPPPSPMPLAFVTLLRNLTY